MFFVSGDKVIHRDRQATVEKSDPWVKSRNDRPPRFWITIVYDDDGTREEVNPEELERRQSEL